MWFIGKQRICLSFKIKKIKFREFWKNQEKDAFVKQSRIDFSEFFSFFSLRNAWKNAQRLLQLPLMVVMVLFIAYEPTKKKPEN